MAGLARKATAATPIPRTASTPVVVISKPAAAPAVGPSGGLVLDAGPTPADGSLAIGDRVALLADLLARMIRPAIGTVLGVTIPVGTILQGGRRVLGQSRPGYVTVGDSTHRVEVPLTLARAQTFGDLPHVVRLQWDDGLRQIVDLPIGDLALVARYRPRSEALPAGSEPSTAAGGGMVILGRVGLDRAADLARAGASRGAIATGVPVSRPSSIVTRFGAGPPGRAVAPRTPPTGGAGGLIAGAAGLALAWRLFA